MGFKLVFLREETLIGGHQRQIHLISKVDQRPFCLPLFGHAVTLQLHIETIGKH